MSFLDAPVTRRVMLAAAVLAGPRLATTPSSPLSAHAASSTPTVSNFDQRLVRDINNARASRGLRRLSLVAGTTDIAHHWSCRMAAHSTLSHNPYLQDQLVTHGSSAWTTYAENIASQSVGYGPDHLFRAYMRHASHRSNILDRSFRYVGIWSKRGNGRRYNTTDFVGSPVSSYSFGYGDARVTC